MSLRRRGHHSQALTRTPASREGPRRPEASRGAPHADAAALVTAAPAGGFGLHCDRPPAALASARAMWSGRSPWLTHLCKELPGRTETLGLPQVQGKNPAVNCHKPKLDKKPMHPTLIHSQRHCCCSIKVANKRPFATATRQPGQTAHVWPTGTGQARMDRTRTEAPGPGSSGLQHEGCV